MNMKKFRVELDITINTNAGTMHPQDWGWYEMSGLERDEGEDIQFVGAELLEEWERKGYDTGDASQYKVGDKVILTESWPDEDPEGNDSPVDYDEDLARFIDGEIVGEVERVDTDDNTVAVRWRWKEDEDDPDEEERTESWWVIPRLLKKVDEEPLKVGDKVKVLRAWTPKDKSPSWTAEMDRTIGKTGKVVNIHPVNDVRKEIWARVQFDDEGDWAYLTEVLQKVEDAPAPDPNEIKAGDTVKVTATVKEMMDTLRLDLHTIVRARKGFHTVNMTDGIEPKIHIGFAWVNTEHVQKVNEVVTAD